MKAREATIFPCELLCLPLVYVHWPSGRKYKCFFVTKTGCPVEDGRCCAWCNRYHSCVQWQGCRKASAVYRWTSIAELPWVTAKASSTDCATVRCNCPSLKESGEEGRLQRLPPGVELVSDDRTLSTWCKLQGSQLRYHFFSVHWTPVIWNDEKVAVFFQAS